MRGRYSLIMKLASMGSTKQCPNNTFGMDQQQPGSCHCVDKPSRKAKKKTKGYKPPQTPPGMKQVVYEPCVHLHFKPEHIDRECLTREQYYDLLATPKGYPWLGEADCQNPELKPKSKSTKKKKPGKSEQEECPTRAEAGDFADEFVEDMWDVMSPEITCRLIDFLVNEFGMSVEEAEDFIDCKSCVGKQTICKKKKSKTSIGLGPKYKWVKEFSDVFSKRIEQYIVSMLLTKRTPRTKRIAEKILECLCNLTGEKTTLQNPKTKIQKTMVLVADRLALWIDDMMNDIDKPLKKRASITEEGEEEEEVGEEGEEEEGEEEEGEEEGEEEAAVEKEAKEPPKDEKPEEKKQKPEKEEETKEEEKEEEKTEEQPEQEEEKEPEPVQEETPPEAEKEEEQKEEEPVQQAEKEEEPQVEEKPDEPPPEEKPEEKTEEPAAEETPVDAQPEPEEETKPAEEVEETPAVEKEEAPVEEEVPPQEEAPVDEEATPQEETPVDEEATPQEETPVDEEAPPQEETPVEEVEEEKPAEEEEPVEEPQVEEEKVPEEEVVEEKPPEEPEAIKEEVEKEQEKKPYGDVLDLVKEDIEGTPKDRRTDRQKADKDEVIRRIEKHLAGKDLDIQPENIDDAASRVAHWMEHVLGSTEPTGGVRRKNPSPAYAVNLKTGSTLEVQKLSSGTVAEKTANSRGVPVPPRERKIPETTSPMNLQSTQEWLDWANNIGNVADEWGKWLESKLTDAEKQIAEKKKADPDFDFKKWRDQAQTEAQKWRVEKQKIKDEGKLWNKKIDKKLKEQPETEVRSLDM